MVAGAVPLLALLLSWAYPEGLGRERGDADPADPLPMCPAPGAEIYLWKERDPPAPVGRDWGQCRLRVQRAPRGLTRRGTVQWVWAPNPARRTLA